MQAARIFGLRIGDDPVSESHSGILSTIGGTLVARLAAVSVERRRLMHFLRERVVLTQLRGFGHGG
jgi:hypothetical protein